MEENNDIGQNKEDVVKEIKVDDIENNEIKIKKSSLWMIVSGILAILFVVSIFTGGFKGSAAGGAVFDANENAFIFMNSDACTTVCDEIEPFAKEIAEKAGLVFSKSKYSQPVQFPGYVLIHGGIIDINGIEDKASLLQAICDATNNEEVCAEVKTAEEEALRGKCDTFTKEETPEFRMFVMSFCPYGQQAMNLVEPVVNDLGSKINFEPNYVIYDKSTYSGQEDTFCEEDVCSMHGLGELHEDMRQKCIWKYDKENYWEYLNCINSNCNSGNVDECWEKCTDKLTDADKIKTCQGEEGIALMQAEKAEMAKFGVRGSEALVLNSQTLAMGDYRWDPNKLKSLICCGFDDAPDLCESVISGATASAAPIQGSC